MIYLFSSVLPRKRIKRHCFSTTLWFGICSAIHFSSSTFLSLSLIRVPDPCSSTTDIEGPTLTETPSPAQPVTKRMWSQTDPNMHGYELPRVPYSYPKWYIREPAGKRGGGQIISTILKPMKHNYNQCRLYISFDAWRQQGIIYGWREWRHACGRDVAWNFNLDTRVAAHGTRKYQRIWDMNPCYRSDCRIPPLRALSYRSGDYIIWLAETPSFFFFFSSYFTCCDPNFPLERLLKLSALINWPICNKFKKAWGTCSQI